MSQVISFEDYLPSPRYDSEPWTSVQIEEADAVDGTYVLIDTIAISPVDADPSQPAYRNFTTDQASDDADLWYRLTFYDTDGSFTQPTYPVQNTSEDRPIYASVSELAQILKVRAADRAMALQRVLEAAAIEIDSEIGTADILGTALPYGSPPAIVSEVNLERAVEHWQQMMSPFGIIGLGDEGAAYTPRDSWDRHAHKLSPLKAAWALPDATVLEIMDAMAEQIMDVLCGTADPLIEHLQVEGRMLVNPSPPAVDIYPADPFSVERAFADERELLFVVRARVSTADSDGGQELLLSLMDPRAATSLADAICSEPSLGGLVDNLVVAGPSAFGIYPAAIAGGGDSAGRFATRLLLDGDGAPVRILWMSNMPWAPSGYGEQTNLFVPRLRALGHELALASNWGLMGAMQELDGMTLYPGDGAWGNSVVKTFAEHHQADTVITLCDAWVMNPDAWPGLRMGLWAPIDHYPIPPRVLAVLQHPQVQPIAMSRDGEGWMRRMQLDPVYVPHGVDTQVFRPQPELRDEVRDALEIPRDAFLIGMVAANKGSAQLPRKSFPQAFDAFAQFAAERPDAWMYCHTDAEASPPQNGIRLDTLAKALAPFGMPEERLRFPHPEAWHLGMPREALARIYQAFDVLLHPSMGEGFGICALEAQACGVPVIASNHSAMPELAQAGWLVSGDRWWDPLQESFLICPAVGSILAALEAAYERREDQELRDAAANFARGYDADLVTIEHWVPALERLAEPREIGPLNGNRKQRRAAAKRAKKVTTGSSAQTLRARV